MKSFIKACTRGAIIGILLACGWLFLGVAFMGHGGTGPIDWGGFLQIASYGAIPGVILSAIAYAVDGPANTFPSDADGKILHSLAGKGFDFSQVHTVQYSVAFERWPPPDDAIEMLRSMYGQVTFAGPDEGRRGEAQFQIRSFVTYEMVNSIQRSTSAAMERFAGVCKSWSVVESAT